MSNSIYVSINTNATNKIITKKKNHEFRKYLPKKNFNCLFVYVTSPISELKYIINISKIVSYPEQINYDGDGNDIFNSGGKSKYAYEIEDVYQLSNPISLKILKNVYGFNPPQAFAYDDCYEKLTEYILNQDKTILWRNENVVSTKHKIQEGTRYTL